ncbi:MAG: 50S ribosomal protein L25 [Patescibacteria group bacterium]
MEVKTLKVELKEKFKKNNEELRSEGFFPAIVYGHGFENKNLVVNSSDFMRLYKEVGESALFNLAIEEDKPFTVIISEAQKDPLSGNVIHIDFHKVRMDEKIKAEIELEFINESFAVKDLGGVLIKSLNKLEVSCLPADLVHTIQVDLSKMKELDSAIRIFELDIPENIEVLHDLNVPVVLVETPKKEEVVVEEATDKGEEGTEKTEEGGVKEGEKEESKEETKE